MKTLESRLGYTFANPAILIRALSHRSLNSERKQGREEMAEHNEQLEFLGDAVLGLLISDYLFQTYPELPEGKLSIHKARIVSAAHLVEVARKLQLGQCLLLGRGEELSGGREKKALLADALEAVLAAVYLDGGLECAREVVQNVVMSVPTAHDELSELKNFKASLQELAQSKGMPQPIYVTVRTDGPEHSKTFVVEARVGTQWIEQGQGPTKKAAGQMAARVLYHRMSGNLKFTASPVVSSNHTG
ncbi:ribonuclease III [Bryobacter aggregatus]|uniref:ribonuclease III n=1 Tax=Bryobacter aggregatus TaxID=360054 RepID=UPI00138DD61E|nr:ribonuclease III [Bryobacter aggregatus]